MAFLDMGLGVWLKTMGRCPIPRKLFEKSLIKNFNKNRAMRDFGVNLLQ